MNVDDGLWQRLSEYSLDDPDALISFSARLRRENDWSVAYTQRVVEEYRRFLYLVCTAEHEVTPSEDVDAAWHLHLVHTRSYWDELCGEVLRRPIHHGPTKGGGRERQRFGTSYENTLATYREFFGAAPPADIWPSQAERFAKTGRMRWIDIGAHWVVRKPAKAWRRAFWLAACAVLVTTIGLTGASASTSGKSGDFIGILMLVGLGGVFLWRGIRWMMMPQEERAAERAKTKGGDGGCSGGCSSGTSSSDNSGDSGGCGSGGCSGGSSD